MLVCSFGEGSKPGSKQTGHPSPCLHPTIELVAFCHPSIWHQEAWEEPTISGQMGDGCQQDQEQADGVSQWVMVQREGPGRGSWSGPRVHAAPHLYCKKWHNREDLKVLGCESIVLYGLQHPGRFISPIWEMYEGWMVEKSWWRRLGNGDERPWGEQSRVCITGDGKSASLPQASEDTEHSVRSQVTGKKNKNLISIHTVCIGCVSHFLHLLKHDFGEICCPAGKQRLKLRSLILNTE